MSVIDFRNFNFRYFEISYPKVYFSLANNLFHPLFVLFYVTHYSHGGHSRPARSRLPYRRRTKKWEQEDAGGEQEGAVGQEEDAEYEDYVVGARQHGHHGKHCARGRQKMDAERLHTNVHGAVHAANVRAVQSGFGMGAGVNFHEARIVHTCICLRGRKRGMTQQFLNGAQVAASVQQMRGKAVAHRVRRGRGGQAQLHSRGLDHFLHDARVQRTSPRAQK